MFEIELPKNGGREEQHSKRSIAFPEQLFESAAEMERQGRWLVAGGARREGAAGTGNGREAPPAILPRCGSSGIRTTAHTPLMTTTQNDQLCANNLIFCAGGKREGNACIGDYFERVLWDHWDGGHVTLPMTFGQIGRLAAFPSGGWLHSTRPVQKKRGQLRGQAK